MTEKRFKFRRFDVDVENINEIALYEIDNNPSDDLDESNLFYVYSTTHTNIQDIVDKLNNQEERIKELEKENEQLKTERLTWLKNQEELECLSEENEQLKQEKEEIKSKAESFVELYEKDFGKNYYTPPRSGKTVRPQLWIVRKILDEIGILELYGDVE